MKLEFINSFLYELIYVVEGIPHGQSVSSFQVYNTLHRYAYRLMWKIVKGTNLPDEDGLEQVHLYEICLKKVNNLSAFMARIPLLEKVTGVAITVLISTWIPSRSRKTQSSTFQMITRRQSADMYRSYEARRAATSITTGLGSIEAEVVCTSFDCRLWKGGYLLQPVR